MSQPRGGASGPRASSCGGPSLGELSGGNWMAVVDGRSFTGAVRSPVGRVPYLVKAVPTWLQLNFYPPSGGSCRGRGAVGHRRLARPGLQDSYLVDSASSHMLVSKIKPCMSKYKQSYCETANGSLNQLSFI